MAEGNELTSRVVQAVHGLQEVRPDPAFEIGLADHFRVQYGREECWNYTADSPWGRENSMS